MTDDLLDLKKQLEEKKEKNRWREINLSKKEDKERYMKHMILGDEYQGIPTENTPNPKLLQKWDGAFKSITGREMTMLEWIEFYDKYTDANKIVHSGYGIREFISEKNII